MCVRHRDNEVYPSSSTPNYVAPFLSEYHVTSVICLLSSMLPETERFVNQQLLKDFGLSIYYIISHIYVFIVYSFIVYAFAIYTPSFITIIWIFLLVFDATNAVSHFLARGGFGPQPCRQNTLNLANYSGFSVVSFWCLIFLFIDFIQGICSNFQHCSNHQGQYLIMCNNVSFLTSRWHYRPPIPFYFSPPLSICTFFDSDGQTLTASSQRQSNAAYGSGTLARSVSKYTPIEAS